MRGGVLLLIGMSALAHSTRLEGQSSRSTQDTLRYREVTMSSITFQTPRGPASVPTDQRATISVVPSSGDSAHAWYDSVVVSMSLPTGDVKPDLSELRGKEF